MRAPAQLWTGTSPSWRGLWEQGQTAKQEARGPGRRSHNPLESMAIYPRPPARSYLLYIVPISQDCSTWTFEWHFKPHPKYGSLCSDAFVCTWRLGRLYGELLDNPRDEQNQPIPKVQPNAVTEAASPPGLTSHSLEVLCFSWLLSMGKVSGFLSHTRIQTSFNLQNKLALSKLGCSVP